MGPARWGGVSAGTAGYVAFVGGRCYFRKGGPFGPVDVGRLRVERERLLELVERIGPRGSYRATGNGLVFNDESLYKRALVYAVAVAGLRARVGLRRTRLAESVRSLDDYELHFWYTEAVDRYRRRGLRGLGRVSRAFRALHGVD